MLTVVAASALAGPGDVGCLSGACCPELKTVRVGASKH
jgi:hypothetical protein